MATSTTFWDKDNPASPPLTMEVVKQVEQQFDVQLPAELLSLLAVQNGGYTSQLVFPTPELTPWEESYVDFEELWGLTLPDDGQGPLSILDTAYLRQQWSLPNHLVLLSGDGHSFIALDYRQEGVSSVVWLDTQTQEELQLAPSFAEFLTRLVAKASLKAALGMDRSLQAFCFQHAIRCTPFQWSN